MKKMKYLRTWLVAALLVTIIGSLTGGTVAWFTDSVESTGNVIETGTLDVELYVADSNLDVEAEGWKNVENETNGVFNYNKWEPGYTAVKYFKIVNNGNLAFKYQIKLTPNMTINTEVTNLAEVIDVYYQVVGEGFTAPTKGSDVISWNKVNLEKMLEVEDTAVHGVMLGDQESMVIAVALHMQEGAGNEYQGLKIGDNFTLQLYATQYTKETDAFGSDQYDAGASYLSVPVATVELIDPEEYVDFTPVICAGPTRTNETVDVGYIFTAQDTAEEAEKTPYGEWHADFTISFDKPVKAGIIGLAGAHSMFENGSWLGFDLTQEVINAAMGWDETATDDLPANTAVRMLGTVDINWKYKEICELQEFRCGTYAVSSEANGITATVELRLYENKTTETNANDEEETGKYVTIASFPYTYEYKGE